MYNIYLAKDGVHREYGFYITLLDEILNFLDNDVYNLNCWQNKDSTYQSSH